MPLDPIMNPFFNSTERFKSLFLEAEDWCGTPFVPHGAIKHVGADCVGLVAGIYLALGALKEFQPGSYSMDEGGHLENSKVLAWLNARREFVKVSGEDAFLLQPGDTICFHLGRVEHHVGLFLGEGKFIHALPQRFAMITDLRNSYYSRRITAIYRPQEI